MNNYIKGAAPNLRWLHICEKIYGFITIIVIVQLFASVLYTVVQSFVVAGQRYSVLPLLYCGLITPVIYAAAEIYSCYSKKTMYSAIAPFIVLPSMFLNTHSGIVLLTITMMLGSIVFLVLILFLNKKYTWLEQQEGFPHFSSLLSEQQKKSEEIKVSDPYEKRYQQIISNQRDGMEGITLSDDVIEQKNDSRNNYMDEI